MISKTTAPWKTFSFLVFQLSYMKMVKCNRNSKSPTSNLSTGLELLGNSWQTGFSLMNWMLKIIRN